MAYQVLLPSCDGKYLLNVHSNVDVRNVIEAEGLSRFFDLGLIPERRTWKNLVRPDTEKESSRRDFDEAL